MSSTEAAKLPTVSVHLPTEGAAERRSLIDEAIEETRLRQSMLDALATHVEGMNILRQRIELFDYLRGVALKRTSPADWILNAEGKNQVALLRASGAAKMRDVYGIRVFGVRPTDAGGNFRPEEAPVANGATLFRAWGDAESTVTGIRVQNITAQRRTDETFAGRLVDANDSFVKLAKDSVGVNKADLTSAVYTLLLTKAVRVIAGMSRVPVEEIASAWKGTEKKTENIQLGHGGGSSADRQASNVTPEEVKAQAAELGNEILRRVGGEKGAAGDLLRELTANKDKGFAGFDSTAKLTQGWQIEAAWRNLKAHKTFGDNTEAAKKPEAKKTREPGED